MEMDWELFKKKTLWHYEKLIAKINEVLEYSFVEAYYGHNMIEAGIYAQKILEGYLQNAKDADFMDEITKYFGDLDSLGICNYRDLVGRVDTKSKCGTFIEESRFRFEALVQVLNYLFRWVLPFRIPIKELTDTMPATKPMYLEIFKGQRVRSNLDVLEFFRSGTGRKMFSTETGMDETYILELTHRADISRLAYVRGKTIKHLAGGGYNTLNKIANVELTKMEADMTAYYESIGKSYADFKTVIPLGWMSGGARILPKIVED